MTKEPTYVIALLHRTDIDDSHVSFMSQSFGFTQNINDAAEYPESVVNENLGFYDDGERHMAILKEAVQKHSSPGLLLSELTSGAVKHTNNQMRNG